MKSARQLGSVLLLVLLTGVVVAADLPNARPESVGMSTQRLSRLKSEMQALVDSNQLAGVVTMVARDGKVVEFDAAGKRDLESAAPLQKDAIFRVYSMSKPITGVAMMMLFEEGKWQLNDPVSKHIPEFANLKVAKVNPQTGAVTQVAPDHAMTMRELMSHSGGLTYGVFGSTAVDKMYTDVNVLDRDAPLQAMIDKLGKIPLLHQPGERWHYSVSVDVQGYLVEKLSGQPFPEFLRQRIFEPLGMKDTAFYVPPEKLNRFVSFYTYDKDRKFVPHPGPDYSKRRPGLDRDRLHALLPDAAERRRARRPALVVAADRATDALQRAAVERANSFAGHGIRARLRGRRGSGCGRRLWRRRHVLLGRLCRHVVLDRSGLQHDRGRHDSAARRRHA